MNKKGSINTEYISIIAIASVIIISAILLFVTLYMRSTKSTEKKIINDINNNYCVVESNNSNAIWVDLNNNNQVDPKECFDKNDKNRENPLN